jgi:hypothetical protein
MASTSGQLTVNTAVPYLGELFQSGKRPNALLKMIGGIRGGVIETASREFPVGITYALDAPAQPGVLEGAAAPTAEHFATTQATNVVQIFHQKVETSYLAQGDKSVSGVVPIPQGAANSGPVNPRSPEFQVQLALDSIAQDVNYSFLRGSYVNPANPASTALKTRGLLTAVTTNAIDNSGESAPDAATYRGWIQTLVKTVVTANGYNPDDTWTLFCDATEYNNVQAAFEALSSNRNPESRDVAGMKIRILYTRFGIVNLVLEPDMPSDKVLLANLGVVSPVGLPVPGKGILFEEALSKTGSSDATQIYGQMGIDHGPEFCHGVLTVPSATAL